MSETPLLLIGINIESEKARACAASVREEALKPIASAFAKNIIRVRNLLSMPQFTTQSLLTVIGVLLTLYHRSESFKGFLGLRPSQDEPRMSPEMTKQFLDPLLAELMDAKGNLLPGVQPPSEVVCQSLSDLATRYQEVRDWFEGQLAAATTASWTAVECLATDVWVAVLNLKPMGLYLGVLKADATGEMPEGLTSKQITVGLLAKYGFDLRSCLGTLLKPKFDLTSLTNIQKAYEAAFGKSKELDDLFADRDLNLLEASRHVIVHRAGIADDEFISRTRNMGISVTESDQLPLNGDLVSKMANAGIRAGCMLLRFVDARLVSHGGLTTQG